MNFETLIQFTPTTAEMNFVYNGSAEKGLLAWLDSDEVERWWKADSAVIEPFSGGMFYLAWQEGDGQTQHAIYGVVDKVDVERKIIEVTKIMYVFPGGKLGHIHLYISFQTVSDTETRFQLVHRHAYQGEQLKLYKSLVKAAWPKTFSLLKKYLEENNLPA